MNEKAAARTIARDCLALRIRKLNRMVTAVYDDALRPLGMTASQLNMLTAIVRAGASQLTPAELSRLLEIEKSTLSRNLPRMEAHGWIDASGDRVRLTAKGDRLLRELAPAWRRAQRETRKLLGEDGAEAVVAMVERVRGRG